MTTLSDEQARLSTGALVIIAAIAGAWALSVTQIVVVPFVLAMIIFAVVSPLLDLLVERWRVPHPLAVLLCMLAIVGPLVVMGLLLTSATLSVVATATKYEDSLRIMVQQFFDLLEKHNIDLQQEETALRAVNKVAELVTGTVGTAVNVMGTLFLLLIFLAFLLAGRNPEHKRTGIYLEVDNKVRQYLIAKFAISGVTGIGVWAILWLFGFELAVLFGTLAFLLNFIPSVGSVIATLLPLPLALAQFGPQEQWWSVIGVVAVPGALQMLVGNVIEPRIMGRGLDLHPVTVILALAFWGLLWGVIGMMLAIPITAVVQLMLDRYETTRGVAQMLAGRLPEAPTQA